MWVLRSADLPPFLLHLLLELSQQGVIQGVVLRAGRRMTAGPGGRGSEATTRMDRSWWWNNPAGTHGIALIIVVVVDCFATGGGMQSCPLREKMRVYVLTGTCHTDVQVRVHSLPVSGVFDNRPFLSACALSFVLRVMSPKRRSDVLEPALITFCNFIGPFRQGHHIIGTKVSKGRSIT